ncbi:MAG: aldehyde dehydrogenase family protein [Candidatus Sumerlaeota bacterium]|nr:aldehyde dehydrogenase family protein [Candidatus Sumerlaeota bacterium]
MKIEAKDRYDLWIGGKYAKASRYDTVRCPYDGRPVGEVPKATLKELDAATGKPIVEARGEVARAIQTLIFSAEEAKRIHGELVPLDAHPNGAGRFGFTLRVPRGVVAAITPFNFPINLACHKIGPAIAAGNSIVLKPASNTPRTGFLLADLFAEAGLPDGGLNVVSGSGGELGDPLVADRRVRMVTFTGSADVGRRILSTAGIKMVTLELGSNSAVVICDDANIEDALVPCVVGGYAHSGQVCISLQRIYADQRVYGDFLDAFKSRVEALKIGDPLDETSQITSLIRPEDADRSLEWIDEARAAGATIVTGGHKIGRATVVPTIIAHTKRDMKVIAEEAFAPLTTADSVGTLEEAIARVNDSALGLQAGIFTRDLDRALYAAHHMDAGGVMINDVPTFRVDQMPYGGVKDSGLGKEGPKYACEEMTCMKMIAVKRKMM